MKCINFTWQRTALSAPRSYLKKSAWDIDTATYDLLIFSMFSILILKHQNYLTKEETNKISDNTGVKHRW